MYTKSKALVLTLALAMMSLPVHSDPFSIDQPEAPTGLQAVAVSGSSILLSWEPPQSPPSLPIVGYSIHYVPTQGGQGKEIVVNTTSHLFDSLKPSTNYTFRVVAFNGKSDSVPSKRVVQMTKEVEEPEAPSGLQAVTKSSSSILLSWEPALSPPSLPVEAYAIHYVPTEGGQEENVTVDNTTTSHLIDRLRPSTYYTFQVIAYNSKGASEPSESVVQMTAGSLRLGLGFSALSPPLVYATSKHPVVLNCTGYSENGPLRLSWRFEEKDLTILSNGSLRIDRLAPHHQKREQSFDGNYTCVLRNDVGALISTPIQVVLARMSESFTLEPETRTAASGGQALFNCEIDAVPPATTTWYRNGVKIPPNYSRYTILPSGSLQITGTTLEDLGSYHCQCSNIAGVKNSSKAWLLPGYEHEFWEPVFLHHRHQETAVAGTPAVLECFADGSPKVDYSWKREDGKEITEQHLLGNGNLFFPQVQPEHAGTYVCFANVTRRYRGQIQEESHSIQAFLIVYVPPIFTKVPTSQIIPPSATVRFYCEVESHPASTIYWVKDGERLNISGRIKLRLHNTLVVTNAVTSDSGIYQCIASNPAGVNASAARLLVRVSSDRPQAPTGLQAVAESSTAISLSWEPARSPPSLPIAGYRIYYALTQGGQKGNEIVVNTTSHLFDSLKPSTNYTFQVIAYNKKGGSNPTEPVVQMTKEDGYVHGMRK